MDTFIEKYISTVNKNNIFTIDIGTYISDAIFINKHTSTTIHNILETLKKKKNVTISKPTLVKTYYNNNTVCNIYKNKVINYSYTTTDSVHTQYKHIHCKLMYMNINTKPTLQSNFQYNLIEETEEIIIQYKNYFSIILTKYPNLSYGCTIKIVKPIEKKLLLENITYILDLC
jgi:hypothetical protein